MTPQEYLEFTHTTRRPGLSDEVWGEYLQLGLIEEVGEFAGKAAKVVRDHGGDWDAWDGKAGCTFREAAILELGDVMYMVVQRAPWSCSSSWAAGSRGPYEDLSDALAWLAAKSAIADARNIAAFVGPLAYIASALGSSLDEVVERNVAKLSGRLVRGTISGQGDAR